MPNQDETLAAWLRLLLPGGTLILVEGRWSTGAALPPAPLSPAPLPPAPGQAALPPAPGLTAAEAGRMVLRHRADATITTLDDPALWGHPITDERYLLVSRH
jgi:hypothetical protein